MHLILVVLAIVLWSNSASAYVDPGTGGAIYSFLAPLIGFLLAVLALILKYFKQIYSFVKGLFWKSPQQ
uniref:hypothetical protein n=1 Tax=Candidatus Tripitaka californicus TaxID=3367616 RepID=UPI00402A49A9